MTPAEQKQLDAIERDRQEREREMLWLLLLLVGKSIDHASSSVLIGHGDPTDAASNVILGNPDIEQDGIIPAATKLLAVTYEAGLWRARKIAGVQNTPGAVQTPSADVMDLHRPAATTFAQSVAKAVNDAIEAAIDTAQAAGGGVKAIAKSIRGLVKDSPIGGKATALRAIIEPNILTAYNGALWNIWTGPGMGHITGFVHRSVLDDVTTEICRERADFASPKDDPYWKTNWPMLHWRCRSVAYPVFGAREWSTDYPVTPPMAGFGLAPAGAIAA